MSVLKPPAWTPPRLDAQRPNTPRSTCPRTARGKAQSRTTSLRIGTRSRPDQDLILKLRDALPGAVDRMAPAALTPSHAAHPCLDEGPQILRQAGREVVRVRRRFRPEGDSKKIVFYTSEAVISMKTKRGLRKTNLKRTQNEPQKDLVLDPMHSKRAHPAHYNRLVAQACRFLGMSGSSLSAQRSAYVTTKSAVMHAPGRGCQARGVALGFTGHDNMSTNT